MSRINEIAIDITRAIDALQGMQPNMWPIHESDILPLIREFYELQYIEPKNPEDSISRMLRSHMMYCRGVRLIYV